MTKTWTLGRTVVALATLGCGFCLPGAGEAGAAGRVNLERLVEETQKASDDPDVMDLIWWMPLEFWLENMLQADSKPEEIAALEQTLSPYVMIGVAHGALGPMGGVTWTPHEEMLKPLLTGIIGPMGEQFHVFFFQSVDDDGNEIVDGRSEGGFSVRVAGMTYAWQTPLESLTTPKMCPVDQRELNGTWKYCPWHGKELVSLP